MLLRLYVNNFRCFSNFEWHLGSKQSQLLLGRNGAGKSTLGMVLQILQKLGRGKSQLAELVKEKDFPDRDQQAPMRIEIKVKLGTVIYDYILALDFPANFNQPRIFGEALQIDGQSVFSRKFGEVTLPGTTSFTLDWHSAGLTLIQPRQAKEKIDCFTAWLAQMLVLTPSPAQMRGDAEGSGNLFPACNLSNLGEWFFGIHSLYPEAYGLLQSTLQSLMPEFKKISIDILGRNVRGLSLEFQAEQQKLSVELSDLSDGEKCFLVAAMVMAANQCYGPLLCFWDEPDNYISLVEVGYLMRTLRSNFANRGQLIVTSHDAQTIRSFGLDECTILTRKNRLEPPLLKTIDEDEIGGNLINALLSGYPEA